VWHVWPDGERDKKGTDLSRTYSRARKVYTGRFREGTPLLTPCQCRGDERGAAGGGNICYWRRDYDEEVYFLQKKSVTEFPIGNDCCSRPAEKDDKVAVRRKKKKNKKRIICPNPRKHPAYDDGRERRSVSQKRVMARSAGNNEEKKYPT